MGVSQNLGGPPKSASSSNSNPSISGVPNFEKSLKGAYQIPLSLSLCSASHQSNWVMSEEQPSGLFLRITAPAIRFDMFSLQDYVCWLMVVNDGGFIRAPHGIIGVFLRIHHQASATISTPSFPVYHVEFSQHSLPFQVPL